MINCRNISFIIPAYNAEKNLEKCVESIVKSYKCGKENIEILVIENGSTDRTVQVAYGLMNQYDFVKVFRSEKGVSRARNMGIEKATYEWIVFVDADDLLSEQAVCVMQKDISQEASDLYVYGHYAGIRKVSKVDGNESICYTGKMVEQCRVQMLENPTRYMTVWGKLFRKSIISKYNIKFSESLKLSEDADFVLRYSRYCKNICLSKDLLYVYVLNNASVMRAFDGTKVNGYITALEETIKHVSTESEKIKNAFNIYILMHLNIVMVREVFAVNNTEKLLKKYRQMKIVISKNIFKNAINSVKINQCTSVRMLPILCLKVHMNVIAAIAFWLRAVQNHKRENK